MRPGIEGNGLFSGEKCFGKSENTLFLIARSFSFIVFLTGQGGKPVFARALSERRIVIWLKQLS
jgi:hypothetical protein